MPYPFSSKNIISSSSEVVYPSKKRLFAVAEDFSKPKCTTDENRTVVGSQSGKVVPDSTSSSDVQDAAGSVMEIASIEFALKLARSVTILPVDCRGRSAEFHLDRFISGTRGPCILYRNHYYTPYRFVLETGCDTDIEWSIAIKYAGVYIKSLIKANILRVHEDDCRCRKCRTLIRDLDVLNANTSFQHSSQPMDLTKKNTKKPLDYTKMGDRDNSEQKKKMDEDLSQQRQVHASRSYTMRDDARRGDAIRYSMAGAFAYASTSTAPYLTREQQFLASLAGSYTMRNNARRGDAIRYSMAGAFAYASTSTAPYLTREQQYLASLAGHSYPMREERRLVIDPYGNAGPSTAAYRPYQEQEYTIAQASHSYPMREERRLVIDPYGMAGPSTAAYRPYQEQQYTTAQASHSYPMREERRLVIDPYGMAGPSTAAYRPYQEQQYTTAQASHSYPMREERRLVIDPYGNAGPSTAAYRPYQEQQYTIAQASHSYPMREERRLVIDPYGNAGPSTAAYRPYQEQQYTIAQASYLHATVGHIRERSIADLYAHAGPSNLSYYGREERREVRQYAASGLDHRRPGGSNMNNPYGNLTAPCTSTSTSTSTPDVVCVYDVRMKRGSGTESDKLQNRQRGVKHPALAVVENTPKKRYDPPKEQANASQQTIENKSSTIIEPSLDHRRPGGSNMNNPYGNLIAPCTSTSTPDVVCVYDDRMKRESETESGQDHRRPGGSNMNNPYGNLTAPCTSTSTSTSTPDVVCVYDVRMKRGSGTESDKLQNRQRGVKHPALAVVENTPKKRYYPPKEQANASQQSIEKKTNTIIEPTPSTSQERMPVQNTKQQNRRDQDSAHRSGSSHTHPPCDRQNGLRHDQSRIRHGRDPESRIAPPVVPLLANLKALSIVGIIPESGHYIVRHADKSIHEYVLVRNQRVVVPEDYIRPPPIANVTPEIHVTPPNYDIPPSPGAHEQVVGDYIEIDDDEVD